MNSDNAQVKKDTHRLLFGHLGNGILVWDKTKEERGDYIRVAHINIHRQITYYKGANNLNYGDLQTIEDYRNTQNPKISESQDEYVFLNKV